MQDIPPCYCKISLNITARVLPHYCPKVHITWGAYKNELTYDKKTAITSITLSSDWPFILLQKSLHITEHLSPCSKGQINKGA